MSKDRSVRQTLSGKSDSGSETIAEAYVWQQFPPAGQVPNGDYVLTISIEELAGTIRWNQNNDNPPSNTNGIKISSGSLTVGLDEHEVIYFSSTSTDARLNWTLKYY